MRVFLIIGFRDEISRVPGEACSLCFYVRVAFVSESLMDLCEHSSVSLPDFFRRFGCGSRIL